MLYLQPEDLDSVPKQQISNPPTAGYIEVKRTFDFIHVSKTTSHSFFPNQICSE